MLPVIFDVALLGACFASGAWIAKVYHEHRAYQLRLATLRCRVAEWAVSA